MNKNELIITTALRLFVENGFHGTATSKIAQEAGVANGTLFNYYATKEVLIVSMYVGVVKKMDDFIIDSMPSHSVSKESFRSLFWASLQWNLNNPVEYKYIQLFNNSPYTKAVPAQILNQQEHPLYVLIQNGIDVVLLKLMPVGFLLSLFTAQINGLYNYILSHEIAKENQLELIEETFELLWKMIED
jgi:AcrR family transcriptional regulator